VLGNPAGAGAGGFKGLLRFDLAAAHGKHGGGFGGQHPRDRRFHVKLRRVAAVHRWSSCARWFLARACRISLVD